MCVVWWCLFCLRASERAVFGMVTMESEDIDICVLKMLKLHATALCSQACRNEQKWSVVTFSFRFQWVPVQYVGKLFLCNFVYSFLHAHKEKKVNKTKQIPRSFRFEFSSH